MLQRFLASILAGLFALSSAGVVHAEKGSGAEAIVQKAIKATGGEENLTRHKAVTWEQKGKFFGIGDAVDYTARYTIELPDKLRLEVKDFFTQVVNGDKGWSNQGGDTEEMNKQQLAEQKETLHLRRLATLVPLLTDKTLKLTVLDDAKVDDHSAAVIKVVRAGHRDATLFFDKETGLLVKIETVARNEQGKEVPQENRYGDYRDVDGVKVAMKATVKREGKPYIEADNSDVKFLDTVKEDVFQKP